MIQGYLNQHLLAVISTNTYQQIFHLGNCLIYQAETNTNCVLRLARSTTTNWQALEQHLRPEDGAIACADITKKEMQYTLCNMPTVMLTEETIHHPNLTLLNKQRALLQPSTNPLKDITQHLQENCQFGFASKTKILILYSPTTIIEHQELIPPTYYGNWLHPFNKKKNEENNKKYEKIIKALHEGNAENLINEYLEKYL